MGSRQLGRSSAGRVAVAASSAPTQSAAIRTFQKQPQLVQPSVPGMSGRIERHDSVTLRVLAIEHAHAHPGAQLANMASSSNPMSKINGRLRR